MSGEFTNASQKTSTGDVLPAFSIGLKNIADAKFIRENFIPVAVKSGRWNLVASESHRVIELVLNGSILLLNKITDQRKCKQKHNLERLVQKFEDSLIKASSHIPVAIGCYDERGDGYEFALNASNIRCQVVLGGSICTIGCSSHEFNLDKSTTLSVEIDGHQIILKIEGEEVIRGTDSTFAGRSMVNIKRMLDVKSCSGRLIELKNISKIFRHELLMDARYSKRMFSEQEALSIKDAMDRMFESSENLVALL